MIEIKQKQTIIFMNFEKKRKADFDVETTQKRIRKTILRSIAIGKKFPRVNFIIRK